MAISGVWKTAEVRLVLCNETNSDLKRATKKKKAMKLQNLSK